MSSRSREPPAPSWSYLPSCCVKLTVTLAVTKEVLSQALGVRGDSILQELQDCLRLSGLLGQSDQDLIRFFIKQPQFQDWLRAPTSQILLINANVDEVEASFAMTWLSARLLGEIDKIRPILTVHFFCSQFRRSAQTITNDAAGMLKMLIFPLLNFAPDLTFLDSRMIGAIEDGTDVGVLFETFEKMLLQLPSRTFVFCVIDNISLYENGDRCDDLVRVICGLRRLIRDEGNSLIIKVLLTCHGQSRFVGRELDDTEKLSGYGASGEDCQVLNENAWYSAMGKPLAELESAARSRHH